MNTIYSSTKVKARNLLTNVGYRRFKDSDLKNFNFISDLLLFYFKILIQLISIEKSTQRMNN